MNPVDHIQCPSTCDLCGADLVRQGICVAAGQQQLLGVAVPLSTVVCRQCRFVFQPERFSDELLAALYRLDTSFDFGEAGDDQPKIHAGLAERQEVISSALAAHNLEAGATVLDVGGGRGECCQHLVAQHRVVVADATECATVDPRIEKVPGLFSSSLGEGTFDAVVMNHILEHVFSPTEFLATARRVLKDGGILIVEVPFELYTPLVARHLGDWRHVGYFSRATLRQYLEKSGFAVTRLVLEEGCYGTRRLPVIRAVARKIATPTMFRPIRNTALALAADMLAPAALLSLAKSRLARR
jgi:SAM-dependent methyltransferase